MRKYCYQITMNMLPAYFIVLAVTVVLSFAFMPKAHGQTNEISLYETSRVNSTNLIPDINTDNTLLIDKIVDDETTKLEYNLDLTNDLVKVSSNKEITNMVVYDIYNRIVEDVIIDITDQKVDFSASCPGVYYIRVDYAGGCQLKRIKIQ